MRRSSEAHANPELEGSLDARRKRAGSLANASRLTALRCSVDIAETSIEARVEPRIVGNVKQVETLHHRLNRESFANFEHLRHTNVCVVEPIVVHLSRWRRLHRSEHSPQRCQLIWCEKPCLHQCLCSRSKCARYCRVVFVDQLVYPVGGDPVRRKRAKVRARKRIPGYPVAVEIGIVDLVRTSARQRQEHRASKPAIDLRACVHSEAPRQVRQEAETNLM